MMIGSKPVISATIEDCQRKKPNISDLKKNLINSRSDTKESIINNPTYIVNPNFQGLALLAHFSVSLSTFLTMNVLSCLKWCSICYQIPR